jgi:NAD(P)-dependent dehydrogenase (short-subunit alcohol dehydrogenase family)
MIALITGAGRGIGREIAIALGSKGIRTILVARTEREINAVAQEIISSGGNATAITCDITDPASVASLYSETQKLGKVDILINNAGVAPSMKIEDTSDDDWKNTFATNVDGAFFLIRTYLPDMKVEKNGCIINVASTAAIEGFPYTAVYTASKHALIGLSRAIAKEVSRYNIKVSTICPGFVRTNILDAGITNITSRTGKSPEEAEAQLAMMNRSGKIIEPREVAQAILLELDAPLNPNGREIIL